MKIGEVLMVGDGLFPTVEVDVQRSQSSTNPRTVAALLDTGFDGGLSLPQEDVESLRLPLMTKHVITLGDGSNIDVNVHTGFVRIGTDARCWLPVTSR